MTSEDYPPLGPVESRLVVVMMATVPVGSLRRDQDVYLVDAIDLVVYGLILSVVTCLFEDVDLTTFLLSPLLC